MLFQDENKCRIRNSCGTETVFFTSSNNHQCNSMSSQSNRNWASTTPGKFLSSLIYLRSKPLVFLQALLKVQHLQNVWEGMRFGCWGLSVSEQVPDSPRPHKQHLANGRLKLSMLSASLGNGSVNRRVVNTLAQAAADLLWCLWLIAEFSKVCLSVTYTKFGALLSCALSDTWYCLAINRWVWFSFAPRLVLRCSPVQRAIWSSRWKKYVAKVACGWLTKLSFGKAALFNSGCKKADLNN